MRITEIRGNNMELTEAIKEYATEKLMSLEKLCAKYSPCDAIIEVGKPSNHHAKGDVFRAEINLTIPGETLRVEVEKDSLYAAIDEAKDDLKRQLVDRKER